MGIAAYHRGNLLIRRQIDDARRPVEFELMDELNELEKYPDAGTPFGPITFANDGKYWWALDPQKMWGGFGFYYPTLREAVRRWRVEVTGYDNGNWTAEPRPASPT